MSSNYLFSSRLREAMKEKGISQTALCNVTGIDKAAMSSYLSGRYKPKMDKLKKLASALGVHEAWLAGMMDEDAYIVTEDMKRRSLTTVHENSAEYDFWDEDVPPKSNDLSMRVSFEEQGLLNLYRVLPKSEQDIIFRLLNALTMKR